jgi:amino acid transporter
MPPTLKPTNDTTGGARLRKSLSGVEYFTFGFGTMVGVGWVVLIDDWLSRGGPAGAGLAFFAGGLLLLPVARTYGRLVRQLPDAGAEIAYTEGVFPRVVSFAAAWTMVLSYAIVCPWEAVAVGNLLARVFPLFNHVPLYALGGRTITAPRLAAGLLLTAGIALLNWRGIRLSGTFQNVTTFGLLALFALFTLAGFARGEPSHWRPYFAHPGVSGALLSVLLTLQIVPYFLTGFESVAKGSEEARAGFDPRHFGRAMTGALAAGSGFYVTIIAVVAFVFPWRELVSGHLGTEAAFQRAFGSSAVARVILLAAALSLLKIFNGNFVAATRLLLGIGRRGLVAPSLARVGPRFGTPGQAILLMALFTAAGSLLGDALLVPVSEVGSLAAGVGWFSACAAFLKRSRLSGFRGLGRGGLLTAAAGSVVSLGIIVLKTVPGIPGSFTALEWAALAGWTGMGFLLWVFRDRASVGASAARAE